MEGAGLAEPIVSMSEAQAYVRIETGEEEAMLAGLIRTASAVCESFLNRVVIARDFVTDVPGTAAWQRVPIEPVRTINGVEAVDEGGVATPLDAGGYAVDVDASGVGWVRMSSPARRIRVTGKAGMAAGQNGAPEPIRQGVLRLVAHLFAARDGGGEAPPAAVTALWRPYRKARLA